MFCRSRLPFLVFVVVLLHSFFFSPLQAASQEPLAEADVHYSNSDTTRPHSDSIATTVRSDSEQSSEQLVDDVSPRSDASHCDCQPEAFDLAHSSAAAGAGDDVITAKPISEFECDICLETKSLSDPHSLAQFDCRHSCCRECFKDWVKKAPPHAQGTPVQGDPSIETLEYGINCPFCAQLSLSVVLGVTVLSIQRLQEGHTGMAFPGHRVLPIPVVPAQQQQQVLQYAAGAGAGAAGGVGSGCCTIL